MRGALAGSIAAILEPAARPFQLDPAHRPHVILVCGVNGTGKTTTIGKLAHQFRAGGEKVVLAAGDTFRAAAIEQLEIWGERAGCAVVKRPPGADAAGLAFDALKQARAEGADVLLIDTAGRLHNKAALMDELAKVVRVLRKLDPAAPHDVLLVLDATTGQNARTQVETFSSMVPITGLVVTKLDGTAKGGVVVALARQFGLPVRRARRRREARRPAPVRGARVRRGAARPRGRIALRPSRPIDRTLDRVDCRRHLSFIDDKRSTVMSEQFDPDDERLAEWLKALAHPARLRIVDLLAARGTCICGEIVEVLPLAQATVSQHLKVLKEAGLLQGTIDGKRSCYCLDATALSDLRRALGARLARLAAGCCADPQTQTETTP